MITDFFRSKKEMPKEWLEGVLIDTANNRTIFHYNKVPESQLEKISMIRGIYMTCDQIMISTTDDITFDHTSKVLIDGFQYSFVSATNADSETANNPLGIEGAAAKQYIVLKRPL
jgi:hypothetical protein